MQTNVNISADELQTNTASDLPLESLTPLELINAIHRSPGSYVTLFQKIKGGHIHHGALPTMSTAYPEQLEISTDLYFTVNSYFKPGRSRMPSTGLKYGLRDEKYLSHLNALYVDFDIGRGDGYVWEDAAIELLKLQRDKIIPPFSLIATSGRGCYAVWLLTDPSTGEGIKATPANIRHYKNLHKALHALMPKWLKPDARAIDAARVLRMSQTLNSKSGTPVQWFMVGNARYTLPEMEIRLRTGKQPHLQLLPEYEAPAPGPRPIIGRNLYPARRAGYDAVNAQRAQDIETIEQYRGGFLHGGLTYEDGHRSPGRRFLLSLYCQYLFALDIHPTEIKSRVRDMAARCYPAYPSDVSDVDLKNIFQGIFSKDKDAFYKNLKNDAFHDLLGVSFLPEHIRNQLQTLKADIPAPKESERIKQRRKAVQAILRESGNIRPTPEEIARLVAIQGHTKPSGKPYGLRTIKSDIAYLKKKK